MKDNRFRNIEKSDTWISITKLDKGWSKDQKFVVLDKYNQKYLLRISHISQLGTKQKQFEYLKEIEKLNINAPRPVDMGILSDSEIFMLLTYIEGVDAKDFVAGVSNKKAYELGFKAGKNIRKIHDIPQEEIKTSWWDKYQEKIVRKIEVFNNLNVKIPNKELIIKYINEHLYLLKDRPQKFCHGDYHLGNMIVKDDEIAIIDFDKSNVCDPYDEFKPFCWNVFANEYFETGLIDGYFDNAIPDDFFRVLALYAAETIISHISWAMTFGDEETKTAYKVIESIMKWYDDFNLVIPVWYIRNEYR